MSSETELNDEQGAMHHREITLSDGRYMIFYTFDVQTAREDDVDDQGEDV
ncbi:MAG TPA: hypothetical protein VNA22_03670 [Pyrinomonadaceae bacterium]|nr:hypothetical protein [Pyrinomonadaceae bacterium]